MCLFYSYSRIRSIELAIKALEARANGRNIVNSSQNCWMSMHIMLHVVACCLELLRKV